MSIFELMLRNKLPAFNANYTFHLQWQFEEDNKPEPHQEYFATAGDAMNAMVNIWNTPKTLVHISLSRRNA